MQNAPLVFVLIIKESIAGCKASFCVQEDGIVYYYEAETKTESGIVKTITFVNPDGFSEFTVMANKTVTVTIDGKEYALSAADIGKGFEIAIIAIAALLGLGVTAYMKKKQN